MLKLNVLHIITNLQEYCDQLCDYQINIYCILYHRKFVFKGKDTSDCSYTWGKGY